MACDPIAAQMAANVPQSARPGTSTIRAVTGLCVVVFSVQQQRYAACPLYTFLAIEIRWAPLSVVK